jgi:hypothetical protein
MKVRNREQLVDLLDSELSWRKKELTFIKSNIGSNSANYKTFLRSGILLLYAHWEGFVKNSCEFYLSYVKYQKLKYIELKENFIALGLKNNLSEFEQTNKSTIHCQLVEFLLNKLNQRANIPNENIIKTGSNLNSSILKEILASIGVDYSDYELKSNLIDLILLKNRNSIAHGQFIELDDIEFSNLHAEIIWIMDDIKTKLINAAVLEEFKTKNNYAQYAV